VSCFQQHSSLRQGGLFGNAHDAAMQLAIAGIAALAVTAGARAATRWLALACAMTIVLGLVATRTVGALVAFLAGAFVLLLLALDRRHRRYALIVAPIVVAALFAWAPLRARVGGKVAAIMNGDLDNAISGRSLPFVAAWRMARDHPLLGVGPGGFASEYFGYKVQIQDDTPSLARVGSSVYNFGEAHNDHLQTLAQLGVPGYLLALAALALLGSASRSPATSTAIATDVRPRIARLLALPLAITMAVAGLSGFPQSLAGPMTAFLYLAGVSLAWSRRRAEPEVDRERA
jgi:putative inorganic carbon (HCO3(-)) transporter